MYVPDPQIQHFLSVFVHVSSQFVIKDSVLSAKASSQDSQNTATPAILLTNVDEVHCVITMSCIL